MITPGYRPALRAHVLNATPVRDAPRAALSGSAFQARTSTKWPLRRMLAWAVGVSFALYLAVIYAATWAYQLGIRLFD